MSPSCCIAGKHRKDDKGTQSLGLEAVAWKMANNQGSNVLNKPLGTSCNQLQEEWIFQHMQSWLGIRQSCY